MHPKLFEVMKHRVGLSACTVLLMLNACDLPPPPGPTWGAWRGWQPGEVTAYARQVELRLEGTPDAPGGRYDIAWDAAAPSLQVAPDERRWADRYARQQRQINGRSMTVIVLRNAPSSAINQYALFPDNSLHALWPDGTLRNGKVDALYTLSPAAPNPSG